MKTSAARVQPRPLETASVHVLSWRPRQCSSPHAGRVSSGVVSRQYVVEILVCDAAENTQASRDTCVFSVASQTRMKCRRHANTEGSLNNRGGGLFQAKPSSCLPTVPEIEQISSWLSPSARLKAVPRTASIKGPSCKSSTVAVPRTASIEGPSCKSITVAVALLLHGNCNSNSNALTRRTPEEIAGPGACEIYPHLNMARLLRMLRFGLCYRNRE